MTDISPPVQQRRSIQDQPITFGKYVGDVRGVCDDIRRQLDNAKSQSNNKYSGNNRSQERSQEMARGRVDRLKRIISNIEKCKTVDEVINILKTTGTSISPAVLGNKEISVAGFSGSIFKLIDVIHRMASDYGNLAFGATTDLRKKMIVRSMALDDIVRRIKKAESADAVKAIVLENNLQFINGKLNENINKLGGKTRKSKKSKKSKKSRKSIKNKTRRR